LKRGAVALNPPGKKGKNEIGPLLFATSYIRIRLCPKKKGNKKRGGGGGGGVGGGGVWVLGATYSRARKATCKGKLLTEEGKSLGEV